MLFQIVLGKRYGTSKKYQKILLCYIMLHSTLVPWVFVEFILVCPPATATLLSLCAQGFDLKGVTSWTGLFLQVSQAIDCDCLCLEGCVWALGSWAGHSLWGKARLPRWTRYTPLSACLGMERGCLFSLWCTSRERSACAYEQLDVIKHTRSTS